MNSSLPEIEEVRQVSGPSGGISGTGIRARIVEVARRELAAGGLAGMTIRRVARETGVDPGTVRHYFPTKEKLVQAAADQDLDLTNALRLVGAELGQDASTGTALLAAACRYLPFGELARAAIAVCLTGGSYDSTVFGAFHRQVVTPATGPDDSDSESDSAERRAALVMSAVVGAHLVDVVLPDSSLQSESARRMFAQALDDYLRT